MDDQDLPEAVEDILAGLAVVAAGMLVRSALSKTWEQTAKRPPPRNPAAPGVSWREALVWASLVGATVGIAKVVVRRLMSRRSANPGGLIARSSRASTLLSRASK